MYGLALTMQVLLGAPGSAAAPAPAVRRLEPDRFFHTFSAAHPPALRVDPGDRVVTRTVTRLGLIAQGKPSGPNPQTGPFFVRGAEPGDMLKVVLHRIEPNAQTAVSSTLLHPNVVDPNYLRAGEREKRLETWTIDKARRVAKTTSSGLSPGLLEVPLVPMLGCVATAPAQNEAFSTMTPGRFGGNMDYPGVVAGVTVMLPVNEPGALLFIGDGHARQAHGEVVGSGLETSMDVEFTVELVKKKAIEWPRLESADHIMVAGSSRSLLEALQFATTEMMHWLVADHGYDERTASMLMGTMLEYEIANVVDPNFTIVAKLSKKAIATPTPMRRR